MGSLARRNALHTHPCASYMYSHITKILRSQNLTLKLSNFLLHGKKNATRLARNDQSESLKGNFDIFELKKKRLRLQILTFGSQLLSFGAREKPDCSDCKS